MQRENKKVKTVVGKFNVQITKTQYVGLIVLSCVLQGIFLIRYRKRRQWSLCAVMKNSVEEHERKATQRELVKLYLGPLSSCKVSCFLSVFKRPSIQNM